MILRGLIFVAMAGLSAAPVVQAQGSGSADPAADRITDLARELDVLVDGAISDGLLTPSDDGRAATAACDALPSLDLADYDHLRTYADLVAFTDGLDLSAVAARRQLAAAQIALGLLAEARATLGRGTDPESRLLRFYADILDPAVMPEPMACAPRAVLWDAVIALRAGQADGAQRLFGAVTAYRALPLRVRARLLDHVVPPLAARGQASLAGRLLADFPDKDAALVSEVRNARAFLALSDGALPEPASMLGLIDRPAYRFAVASTLASTGGDQNTARKSLELPGLLHDRLVDALIHAVAETAPDQRADKLAILLDLLDGEFDYLAAIDRIMSRVDPVPETDALLASFLASRLGDDLESGDPDRVIAAIRVLGDPDLLPVDLPEQGALVRLASDRAWDLGLGALMLDAPGRFDLLESDQADRLARLAYHRGDHDMLMALAAGPDSAPETLKLAALSALSAGDGTVVRALAQRLRGYPDALVSIAEAERVQGERVLDPALLRAVSDAADPDIQRRLARIETLWSAPPASRATPSVSAASDALERANRLLGQTQNEES